MKELLLLDCESSGPSMHFLRLIVYVLYLLQVNTSPATAKSHRALVELWGERVARTEFGYDLDEWPCLARTVRLAQQQEEGGESSGGGE